MTIKTNETIKRFKDCEIFQDVIHVAERLEIEANLEKNHTELWFWETDVYENLVINRDFCDLAIFGLWNGFLGAKITRYHLGENQILSEIYQKPWETIEDFIQRAWNKSQELWDVVVLEDSPY